MPLIDWIVAAVLLGAGVGALALRATRAWLDFRLQQRQADLLAESLRLLDHEGSHRG